MQAYRGIYLQPDTLWYVPGQTKWWNSSHMTHPNPERTRKNLQTRLGSCTPPTSRVPLMAERFMIFTQTSSSSPSVS